MNKFMTATQARKQFYSVIAAANHRGVTFTITHAGLPTVVMMSFEEFEGWKETFEIQSNPKEAAAIRAAIKEKAKGKTMSLEAFRKSLRS
jgi:prevent-host-death family protein